MADFDSNRRVFLYESSAPFPAGTDTRWNADGGVSTSSGDDADDGRLVAIAIGRLVRVRGSN